MKKLHRLAAGLGAVALSFSLVACSGNAGAPAENKATSEPTSVENCGRTVTMDHEPQRVVVLKPAPIITMDKLGVIDKVVAKGGQYPHQYYTDALNKKIDAIPVITDKLDPSGHLDISQEMVVAQNPDLVTGFQKTVNAETMASTGIPIVEEPAFCGGMKHDASWDDVYAHVNMYGKLFHREKQAEEYNAELKKRLEEIKLPSGMEGKTVAILYPTIGGGITYTYGRGSMAHPLVETAGLKNVFGDQEKRVFELTGEELVARNPDYIIALYMEGTEDQIKDAVKLIPGSESINAVKNGKILPMLLNYAEPPTPLAVDGLEILSKYLEENK